MDPQDQTPATSALARILPKPEMKMEKQKAEDNIDCPICRERLQNKAIVLNCKHEFCYDCIAAWVESAHGGRGMEPTCPICRGDIASIAYKFDDQGNFTSEFNEAKLWTFSASHPALVNKGRYFKYNGTIFSLEDVAQIKILQTGGRTIFAYLRDLSLCSEHLRVHVDQERLTEYRAAPAETDPEGEGTSIFVQIVENFQKYYRPDINPRRRDLESYQRYSTDPLACTILEEIATFRDGKVRCGLKTWRTLLWESPTMGEGTISVCKEGTIPACKEESYSRPYERSSPTFTQEVRRILGDNILLDFDSTISNIVPRHNLPRGDGNTGDGDDGVFSRPQQRPDVLEHVRPPSTPAGPLFEWYKEERRTYPWSSFTFLN